MAVDGERERVLAYLYGGLDAAAEAEFRRRLTDDEQLRGLLAEEERFDRLVPRGQPAAVADECLAEVRLLVRSRLRRQQRRRTTPRWAWPSRWVPSVALAALAVIVAGTGLLVARSVLPAAGWRATGPVVDLRVLSLDPDGRTVRLEVSTVERTQVAGRVDSAPIRRLLAASLTGDAEAGPRLAAVRLLDRQGPADPQVTRALIQALRADANPGVRLAAVTALRARGAGDGVEEALLAALAGDPNPGVRVAAIAGLSQPRDAPARRVLERVAAADDNPFVKAQAQRLLGSPNQSAATTEL